MRRVLVAAAVSGAVALTASACGIPGLPGIGGTEATNATPTAKPAPKERPLITPRYPALLTHDTHPRAYRIIKSSGGIDFRQGRVRFRLTFLIETYDSVRDSEYKDNEKEMRENVEAEQSLREEGAAPIAPFTVGKARGFVGEVRDRDPLFSDSDSIYGEGPYGPKWGLGAYRLYAVPFILDGFGDARRAMTVTLLVFDPKKRRIGAEHRAMADRLMKSVRPNRAWQGNQPRGRSIGHIVPFGYLRPPGLTGGEEINVDGPLEVEMTFGKKARLQGEFAIRPGGGLSIRFQRENSLRATREVYRASRRMAAGVVKDIGKVPGLRAPDWIIEGHKMSYRSDIETSEEYVIMAPRWVITLRSENPAEFTALRDLVASLKPGDLD